MQDLKLNAQKREITGKKVKNLRKEGLIPSNVYGKKIDSVSL
ncbi:MAG: 50S ribosomal protein L25, partial [Patescibacteria group bacterium]